MLIDSHCHLDLILNRGLSLDEVNAAILKHQLSGVVQIGADPESCAFILNQHDHPKLPVPLWYTIGCHPGEVADMDTNAGLELALSRAHDPAFVAVGEIGLDYYHTSETASLQKEVFRRYLDVAVQTSRGVCIHTRSAHRDTADILSDYRDSLKILIHCFTGSAEEMLEFLNLGAWISFSGIVTFRNAEPLREAARICPMERMLVETDAPYLAPVPFRGSTNHPALVAETSKFLAGLKGIAYEEFVRITGRNTREFYGLTTAVS